MDTEANFMWYSAQLLFRADINDEPVSDPLYEKSVILIKAKSTDEAEERARRKGEEMEHEYLNEHKERVCWRFCRVLTVQDLAEARLVDGTEVFSELFRETGK